MMTPRPQEKKKTKSALEHAICYKCKSLDLKILKKKNTLFIKSCV